MTVDSVKEVSDIFSKIEEKDIVNITGAIVEKGLEDQVEAVESVEGFRECLAETISEINKNEKDPDKKKLIVFIDELDRCRPTYAVEVLECIKHLFSVEGLVFVLTIDDKELRNAIKSAYGADIDADGYLRRFIDWEFKLPKPKAKQYANYLCELFDLASSGRFKNRDAYDGLDSLSNYFAYFAEGLELSLRQQEQCFSNINLAVRSLPENETPLANVTGVMAALRVAYPEQLRSCCLDNGDIEVFLNELEPKVINLELNGKKNEWVKLKPYMHAWFLNVDKAHQLNAAQSALIPELNDLSNKGTHNDRSIFLDDRVKYLGQVFKFSSHIYQRLPNLYSSLAFEVYKRLEGAALYTGRP